MNCLVILSLLFSAPPAAPPPVRESIEWANIWITGGDRNDLPKVLLIGDSIVVGYSQRVADALKDKAYCCRLSTSKSLGDPAYLEEVKLVVSQYPFAVIHFNNGLHGWGYTEEQYQEAFPKLLALLRQSAPQAKLIWATTTPVRTAKQVDQVNERTDRVRARNRIAEQFVKKSGIATDDLFRIAENRPEYYSQDGVHFNQKGVAALAEQVTECITKALVPSP
jgi:hypothetical protein